VHASDRSEAAASQTHLFRAFPTSLPIPSPVRILAFSDVTRWDGYKEMVTEYRPQVVPLVGDLTSDGTAAFFTDAFEAVPAYREAKREALRRIGAGVEKDDEADMEVITGGTLRDVMRVEATLKPLYREIREFTNARRKLHTNRFYSFLKFAGQRCSVLVVKGDHDDDYAGDHQPGRISRISGCQEICGKAVIVDGLSFLELGFDQVRRPRCTSALDEVETRRRALKDFI